MLEVTDAMAVIRTEVVSIARQVGFRSRRECVAVAELCATIDREDRYVITSRKSSVELRMTA